MAPGTEAAESAKGPLSLPQGTEMLGTFLSLMPDAAVAVDGKGTIVAVNERTETFFGYTARELEGRSIELLVPERYRHSHRNDRAEYSSAPRARPMGAGIDLYARRKDGSEFPVDISLAPIGEGANPLVVAALRDITERKAAQSAQAQLAAIVQSSADGIFSMSHRGVITSWNPGAEAMFGFGQPEVVGRHVSLLFPDDPVLEELLDASRAGHALPSRDTRWRTRNATLIDVAISVAPLSGGSEPGFSVLVRDITIRKAAEAQLQRQARWQAATAEIRLSLLSEGGLDASLALVCKWAADLSTAETVVLLVIDGGWARVVALAGNTDGQLEVGQLAEVSALLARAVASGGPQSGMSTLLPGRHARTFPILFPGSEGSRAGALVIMGKESLRLGTDQEEILASLATQAILAFELASVRSQRDRLLISADRERIARDLHDLVIQRLFGAGLRLQGALGIIDNPAAAARVASTVEDLDVTIKEIREAIFALESEPGTGFRGRVLEAVADAADLLGFRPAISFSGLSDREVGLHVQLEAAAVLREALSNAARHAHASNVEVDVSIDDDLDIVVVDDGTGIGNPERFSGIANARARARLLGGTLDVVPGDGGGTRFEWCVPLSPGPSDP